MRTPDTPTAPAGTTSGRARRRRTVRLVAAAVAGVVAVLYLVVFLILLPTISETDNPAPAFAALAFLYLVGAALLVFRDGRALHVVGALLQVLLIGGYLWLFSASVAHGEAEFFEDTLVLAVIINTAQVALAGMLSYLALADRR